MSAAATNHASQGMNIKSYLKTSQMHNSKLDIISSLFHQWAVPELKKAGIVQAYLLNWSPQYLVSQLRCLAGICELNHNGITYEVHFVGCSLDDINKAKKVAISFRKCNELGLQIALIKMIW